MEPLAIICLFRPAGKQFQQNRNSVAMVSGVDAVADCPGLSASCLISWAVFPLQNVGNEPFAQLLRLIAASLHFQFAKRSADVIMD